VPVLARTFFDFYDFFVFVVPDDRKRQIWPLVEVQKHRTVL